jgi:hypothetical protein
LTIEAITPPSLSNYAFYNTNDCPIYVPCESLAAYQTAWSDYSSRLQCIPTPPTFDGKWKATYSGGNITSATCDATSAITEHEIVLRNLVKVEIGSCVNSIGDEAFYYSRSLTNAVIGSGVTSIGSSAFYSCSGLSSVNILDSVTSIGNSAFYGCTSLSSVTIGSGVTNIGSTAFGYCSGLVNLDLQYGILTFNQSAFIGCSSLTSLTIPSSVVSIGQYAFFDCRGLTSITVEATSVPTLGVSVFESTNNCPIYVPVQSVNNYKTASGWSSYASRIQAIP